MNKNLTWEQFQEKIRWVVVCKYYFGEAGERAAMSDKDFHFTLIKDNKYNSENFYWCKTEKDAKKLAKIYRKQIREQMRETESKEWLSYRVREISKRIDNRFLKHISVAKFIIN